MIVSGTPIFSAGDVVKVPYPHVESDIREARPALVVTIDSLGKGGLFWH